MKKSYISLLVIASLGLGMTSCEDRLDIAKHGNMGSQETFYKTDEQADQCRDGAEGTVAHTGAAVDALFRVDGVGLLHRALDRLHGAVLPALAAALAAFGID